MTTVNKPRARSCNMLVDHWLKRYARIRNFGPVWTPKRAGLSHVALTVPYSELAMHTRAAGKPLVAWACNPRACGIVYAEPQGGCEWTTGLPSEVLPFEVREKMAATFAGAPRRKKRRTRRKH